MTMYVILGDGEMPRKALTETLQEMWQEEGENGTFWFLVQAKAEPTATDQVLMAWLAENEIYYETISDGTEVSDIYSGAQQKHTAKRLAPKVVNLLKSQPDPGEAAAVLGLFVSDDPDAEEDRWLNEVIQAAYDADFKSYAFNDGLVEIDMADDEEETEEPAPAPVKAAKKAAARRAGPLEPDLPTDEYTRTQLEEMNLTQLKEIASARGIELPPRTRMTTYVDKILGEGEGEDEVEVAGVTEIEGDDEELLLVDGDDVKFSISAPAMLIVIYNGQVVSRVVTAEEAQAILTGS